VKQYSIENIEAAHDALRPHAQALVDRFGQAQAFEILSALAETVCPDGRDQAPRFYLRRDNLKAAN